MQKAVILFRKELEEENEFSIAQKYFDCYEFRSVIPENSLVIGRFSVLPFYKELEAELKFKNSYLINSYQQHSYIADILQWCEDLKDYTPKTYNQWGNLKDGKWVVKGKTNSRKQRWNTHMFAEDRESLLKVIKNLYDDVFIAEQGIVVRDYVPLVKLDEDFNGMPISKEWRCFCYKDKLLCSGFYWASFPDADPGPLPQEGVNFLQKIMPIVGEKANFYVIDIAEKEEGGYIVVELNDGCMSGLSTIDPENLYSELKKTL